MLQRIFTKTGVLVTDTRDTTILRRCCEEAKSKLSRIPRTTIQTFLPGVHLEIEEDISRPDFEVLCGDLFRSIADEVFITMLNANVRNVSILLLLSQLIYFFKLIKFSNLKYF